LADVGLTSAHCLQHIFISLTLLWNNFYNREKDQNNFLPPATTGWHRYEQFTHRQHAKMLLLTPTVCSNELQKPTNQPTKQTKKQPTTPTPKPLCKISECSAWLPKEIQQLTCFPSSQKSSPGNSTEKQQKRRVYLISGFFY